MVRVWVILQPTAVGHLLYGQSQFGQLLYGQSQFGQLLCGQVQVTLRPTVSVIGFFIFSCRAPSMMRWWVCNLQCNDTSSISSYTATDGLSASSSWCWAPIGDHDQILITLFDNYVLSKSKVKVILRLTVSWPVRPGVRHPFGTHD
jgi:hypothetical protein